MQAHELAKTAEREGLTPLDILLGNAERFTQLALGAQANDKSEDEIIYRGLARENADKRAFPIGKRRRRGRCELPGFDHLAWEWEPSNTHRMVTPRPLN